MTISRLSSLFLIPLCPLAMLAGAETADPGGETLKLDTLVVSAGPDAKAAFDLAQGTAILLGDDLHRRQLATLGDTLATVPGISATYHGPGASRPVIRGLGGERVRMLTNSIGALDASSISPDHNVTLEPLLASRVEVLRGPATLLYGSSAIGGVVNVISNHIPEAAGDGRVHGDLEVRGFGPGNERTGVVSVSAGGRTVIRVNGVLRRSDDLDIPGVARIDAGAPADQPSGTLPSSALDLRSATVGVGHFWSAGHAGLAYGGYDTEYGVPTGDDPPIHIRMHQNRLDFAGEVTQPFGLFRGARARFGYGAYRHAELAGEETGTTFRNRAWETRVELPHEALGPVTGTVGLQAGYGDFSVQGEEVVAPSFTERTAAVFVLEEWKTPQATWQVGARYETRRVRLGPVDPQLPAVPGYAAVSGQKDSRDGLSVSGGVVWYPARDWSLGLALVSSQRLPTPQELFSNGPHGGTGAYEVGTSGLGRERSLGVEVNLRRRAGRVTGSVGLFVNRFRGYIFEEELAAGIIPDAANPEGLTPYQFVAHDAEFYGGEADLQVHLLDTPAHRLHLELGADYVHAQQTTDDEPLPRIPPLHGSAGLRYEGARWRAGVEWREAAAQDRTAPGETRTAGSGLLNADVSYVWTAGRTEWEWYARGTNLTDATARVATSFLKDLAPLPGRGVLTGVRLHF